MKKLTLKRSIFLVCLWFQVVNGVTLADELPIVSNVELQPFKAQVKRLTDALKMAGRPLPATVAQKLKTEFASSAEDSTVSNIQAILDQHVLVGVNINPESRVKVQRGPAAAKLTQHGWSVFLVKVHNEAGVTAPLQVSSPQSEPIFRQSSGSASPDNAISSADVIDRWVDVEMVDRKPLVAQLSGLEVEYRILQLYSRDHGQREATLAFDVGQGTQDLGFRNQVPILFSCAPGVEVTLDVLDDDGTPTTGQFVIKDSLGRIYPARSRRLEPDFFFHDQIYRHSGESVFLPPGQYEVTYSRGPEYRILKRQVTVPNAKKHRESFRLQRWIKLTDYNWYSGDHHVHAAGCAHYESPTQGVTPESMMRHILGEDLNVGCVLSWGPCWYYQKDFFDGRVHELSRDRYLMRYDVEVSGFPSSHTGHLCLLNLKEDDYPGTTKIEEWPSWDYPVLKWGKEQGGVVGFSHSGWGLKVDDDKVPSYKMPPFDGIGANEYVVDVVHDVCDFISTVDTPSVWELSIWYHTLNCGYTCRISGETDFPCIYGERVGLGRIYVKLPKNSPLTYEAWVQGVRDGKSYCGDGLSHLIDFQINGLGVGEPGAGGRASVLASNAGRALDIKVTAAALLAEEPREDIRQRSLSEKPYWHVERARVGNTQKVPVELVVNGQVADRQEIVADGSVHELEFQYTPKRSSWIALRTLPSAHTNPIFVEVDGKPIRGSKRSALWCREAVDVCWNAKKERIRESERAEAKAVFDVARQAYDKIIDESYDDTVR